MAEIVTGRIVGVDPDGLTVRVPFRDWERYTAREYADVLVELPDSRMRTPEQLRKAWAIMADMALYMSGDKRCAEEDGRAASGRPLPHRQVRARVRGLHGPRSRLRRHRRHVPHEL